MMMTQAPPPPPPFYVGPTVLRFPEHRSLGLRKTADYTFAAGAAAVPVTLSEFAAAGRSLPIVFAQDEAAMPLVVSGFEAGRNLLITEAGEWQSGCYVPAYLRRYPFIAVQVAEDAPRVLGIEATSSLVVTDAGKDGGDRLFDEAGAPTERAQAAMALCEAYAQDHEATKAFAAALVQHKLLAPRQVELRLVQPDQAENSPEGEADRSLDKDAVQATLAGFQIVDEEAFRALSGKVVAEFHAEGWLAPIILHLASQQSWQVLVEAAGRIVTTAPAQAA